ncbi:MAG: SDR family oxidoreductase [Nocardioidaceae bacterium]
MDLRLTDRVYIVTAASRGLGRATAEVLVEEGARVVVSSRSEAAVEACTQALGADRAVAVVADNADPQTPTALIEAARTSFGRLDGALISVGGPPPGTVMSRSEPEWRSSFEAVFLGAVRLCTAIAAELNEGGSLALVLSTSVKQPIGGLAISNGLRPGLAMVAKSLADELGPQGIRVNGLLPGRIDTERVRELDAMSGDAEANRRDAQADIPLRRYGAPAEFGRAAAFLLSPAAGYITGVMLPVDGGITRSL